MMAAYDQARWTIAPKSASRSRGETLLQLSVELDDGTVVLAADLRC